MNYVMHLSPVMKKECLERKLNGKNAGILVKNVLVGGGWNITIRSH